MRAKWLIPLALIAAIAAAVVLVRSGDDELFWQLPHERMAAPPRAETRTFTAEVNIGCHGDPAEFGPEDYSVETTPDAVIVTFTGDEYDTGMECLTTESAEVRLPESLGDRALCDGIQDPPHQVFPPADGQREPRSSCTFRFVGE